MNPDLTPQAVEDIFLLEVAPDLDLQATPGSDPPRAVFVAGQPGAGKSQVLDKLSADCLRIDGDRLREYHPAYTAVPDAQMPMVTGPAAGTWLELSLFHAAQRGYDVAWEATLRSPEKVIESLREFCDQGYDINVAIMAVPREASLLSTVERYLDQREENGTGRPVTVEQHDEPYNKAMASIEAIQHAIPQLHLTVVDRDAHQLYPGRYPTISDALDAGRALTPAARAQLNQDAGEQYQRLKRHAGADVSAIAQRSLHEAAPDTVPAPPAQQVSAEQAAQAMAEIKARLAATDQQPTTQSQTNQLPDRQQQQPKRDGPTITP